MKYKRFSLLKWPTRWNFVVQFIVPFYSYSSTGPRAYASDAPQPIGLLCDPEPPPHGLDVPISAARRLHVYTTLEILAAKGEILGPEHKPQMHHSL
jgi:hypothetical protein